MPELIKLYIRHCMIGFGIAAAFVGMLLWFDVMNIWSMASHDPMGWLAILVLWISNGIVFAGVQFGYAIMAMADKPEDDRGPRGGSGVIEPALAPVRIKTDASKNIFTRR